MADPVVADTYRIVIRGAGVIASAAQTAFEDVVAALRLVTAAEVDGGIDPVGTLTHSEATTEQASDVV